MLGGSENLAPPNVGPQARFADPMAYGNPNNKSWFQDFVLLSPIEYPDELDKKMQRAHNHINQLFAPHKTQSQIHNDIMNQQEDVTLISMGLIVSILKDPKQFPKYYQTILYYNNSKAISINLQKLITERWHKFHRNVKETLLTLLRNLLTVQFYEIENIFYTLLRSLAHECDQIYFLEKTVDMFLELPVDAAQNIQLLSYALIRFLRFFIEHSLFAKDNNIRLRAKEQKFCLDLLTTRFADFAFVGRDLIRLIYHAATSPNSPDFNNFYKKLIMNTAQFTPKYSTIIPILKIKTSKDYSRLLITYQLERKVKYFVSAVEFGSHTRPQLIFQRNHLNTPIQQLLRGDIIRYVCTTLRSESSKTIPRWAFVGWLASANIADTHPAVVYNKFAFYYDFLCVENVSLEPDAFLDMEPAVTFFFFTRDFIDVLVPAFNYFIKLQFTFHLSPPVLEFNKACFRSSLREIDKKSFDNNLIRNTLGPLVYPHLPSDSKRFLDEYIHWNNALDNPPAPVPAIAPQQLNDDTKSNNLLTTSQLNLSSDSSDPNTNISGSTILYHPQQVPATSSTPVSSPETPCTNLNNPSGMDYYSNNHETDDCSPFTVSKLVYDNDVSSCTLLPVDFSTISAQNTFTPYSSTSSSAHEIESSSDSTALFSDDEDDEYPSPKKKTKKSQLSNGQNTSGNDSDSSQSSMNKKVTPFDNDRFPASQSGKFSNSNGNLPRVNGGEMFKPLTNYDEPSTFITGKTSNTKDELHSIVSKLSSDNLKPLFQALLFNKQASSKCKEMEKLSKILVKEGFPSSDHGSIVTLLLNIFEDDFDKKLFPKLSSTSPELDGLKESLKFPIFVLFQELFRERNSENRNRTMDVLQDIEKLNSKLRYHLLYFLSVTITIANAEDLKPKSQYNMKLYEDYIAKLDLEMNDALYDDLRCSINDDSQMFFFILPKIYKYFDDSIIYNGPKLIELMIMFGDESHVFELITKIMRNEIRILDEDDLSDLFEKVIQMNSCHQNLAWQIVRSHGFKPKSFIFLLDKFDVTSNNNIFSYLLTLIANEVPTDDLLSSILVLKQKSQRDDFFVSIFVFWCENYSDQISSAVVNYVQNKKNKRDQVFKLLKYFDKVIKIVKKFKDAVLAALIEVVQSTPTLPKNEFKDLLTLINDDQANKPQNANVQNADEKKDTLRTKKLNSGSPKRVPNKKRAAAVAAAAASASATNDDTKGVKRKLDKDSE